MYYLLVLPVIFLAVIVKLVSDRYKLKIFSKICKIIIILGVILFVYLFASYKGYDIIKIAYDFLFNLDFFKLK